jgi:hypothetical protein
MRVLRVLAAVSAIATLATQPLAAQEGRQFKDAWFWGVKGGAMLYSSASTTGAAAPTVGLDWVITRTRGGLYASYDQGFLSTLGSFPDRDPNNVQFDHLVDLSGYRRIQIAGMIFPMQSATVHPYLSAGFSLNQVATAEMQGGAGSTSRYAAALDSVQIKRTSFGPVFMGGVQYRLPKFSVFGQATAAPTQTDFFLARPGGRAFGFTLEGGVRYNVGSSIDKTIDRMR